ncbi:DnaD domain protein [Paenibacillus turpanensis]|uniref:DnaD domain protein n=1 Tax=Paenibacillus turpanensis TaxID=2689078 RepID=UPI001FB6DF12|nr:DnaD domain protein [Paenibacillus turpanensis]
MNGLNSWEQGALAAVRTGSASIPLMFLQVYAKLGLTDTEAMLVIQLHAFMENERVDFPTHEQLQERMSATPNAVIEALEKLVSGGFVELEEDYDSFSGVHFDRFNLGPLWERTIKLWAAEQRQKTEAASDSEHAEPGHPTGGWSADSGRRSSAGDFGGQQAGGRQNPAGLAATQGAAGLEATTSPGQAGSGGAPRSSAAGGGPQSGKAVEQVDVFTMFEKEFGRPLSPMECETIVKWIDFDRYAEPLIAAALKEAVFAGKLRFNYIDRILLEWSRNQVRTVEQAKEYTQRFRAR